MWGDLMLPVLVRQDAMSYVIADQDEFGEMLDCGILSAAEGRGAGRGLRELLGLIEQGRLPRWLGELAPFGPGQPASPGPADATRPGTRPPAAGNPPDW
jgi:hypothetical protein